jgi:spore coat polysaccharide biosynthesis protein SpsF (cytidylyltransferase family)
MGSTRLPGKSMALLGNVPVIDWVIERAESAHSVAAVVVATSTNVEDDALAEHVERHGAASVVRGDPTDVLDRYRAACENLTTPYVVRVTGDCPFVVPELVDLAVETAQGIDYSATAADGRFPRGFDVEAIRLGVLRTVAAEATDPLDREHVTPFVVARPERFASAPLPCPPWARHPQLRVTLDEPADLELLRCVVAELAATPQTLDARAVVRLLLSRPDLAEINASVRHNVVY